MRAIAPDGLNSRGMTICQINAALRICVDGAYFCENFFLVQETIFLPLRISADSSAGKRVQPYELLQNFLRTGAAFLPQAVRRTSRRRVDSRNQSWELKTRNSYSPANFTHAKNRTKTRNFLQHTLYPQIWRRLVPQSRLLVSCSDRTSLPTGCDSGNRKP